MEVRDINAGVKVDAGSPKLCLALFVDDYEGCVKALRPTESQQQIRLRHASIPSIQGRDTLITWQITPLKCKS